MRNGPGSARPHDVPRAGFVGMGALACLFFLDLGTVRIVPWWVTALLVALWLVLFVTATRWFVAHPARVPWLAVAGTVAWAGLVVGGAWLGWWVPGTP